MGEQDGGFGGWRSRLAGWRGSRRQTGAFGAALLAWLAAPDAAPGRGRQRPRLRARKQDGAERRRCDGIAGTPCPRGFVCVDDPRDDCGPDNGGADCGGVCVRRRRNPCARIRCGEGTVCCPRCGGLCIPPEAPCDGSLCNRTPCNNAVCGPGEFCCNESCSRCVPLGGACTDEICLPPGEPCGQAVCGEGEYCCAAHCSLCKPVGETCFDALCPHLADEVLCGQAVCGEGEYCCNRSCGICAPVGLDCDRTFCNPFELAREVCGPVVCPPGEVCCNARCGICTSPDACTAQVEGYGCADGRMRG